MKKYIEVADQIEGWFIYKDICPLLELINKSQQKNHILEIGVHHGKSFIPMITLLKDDEIAVALDVFEDQQYNYDRSGRGCSFKLKDNIKKIYTNNNIFDKLRIIKNDSTTMTSTDYLNYVNGEKYRIISIDGCHTKSATLIDLKNAIQILSDDGIIILDDYFNEHWPGVKFGIDTFMQENNDYRLIYLNANKFIICHRNNYSKFIKMLHNLPNNNAITYESRCYIGEVFKR